MAQAHASVCDIEALAYSSQANSFVLLDQNKQPLTPLILWLDNRVGEDVDPRLAAFWEHSDFMGTTGLGMSPSTLAIAKCRWFECHEPEVWSKTAHVMTISDYLTDTLTGKTVGDQGTASLLGLWNLPQGQWWNKAIKASGLSRSQLSTPLPPGSVAGSLTHQGAAKLGLNPGIPLAVGSLDHHVAALGAGVGAIAPASVSIGTVLACLRYSDTFSPLKNCCMVPAQSGFYQLAFSTNGASVYEWYQQQYASQFSVSELDSLAREVSCEGLTAKPNANHYPGLEGFVGRKPSHGPAHLGRAILESVTESMDLLVDQLFGSDRPDRMVAVGGGARSDLWMQMFADRLGMSIVIPEQIDTACLGSAMFASVAAGWHPDCHDAATAWCQVRQVLHPAK